MKYILYILINILLLSNIQAKEFKLIKEKTKPFSVQMNGGFSTLTGSENEKVSHYSGQISYSYESFGLLVEAGLWNSNNNNTSIKNNLSIGMNFNLSGNLQYKVSQYKRTLVDKEKNITVRKQKLVRFKDYSGFKLSIFASNYKIENPNENLIGGGAKIFYKYKIKKSIYIDIGLRYDKASNQKVEVDLVQGFLSIGMFP